MRPDKAETDSTRADNNVAGIAMINAKVMPAVAMATVRQVSRATSHRKSGLVAGGTNVDKK
jgi:hypothetical protein